MKIDKTKILALSLFGLLLVTKSAFAFSGNDQRTIDSLIKEQRILSDKIDKIESTINNISSNNRNYDLSVKNLITTIESKNDQVDYKNELYSSMLAEIKWTIYIVAALLAALAIGLRLYQDKTINDANKLFDTEKKIKFAQLDENYKVFEQKMAVQIKEDTIEKFKSLKKDFKKYLRIYEKQTDDFYNKKPKSDLNSDINVTEDNTDADNNDIPSFY